MSRGTALYRFFDKGNQLLYVGISNYPASRVETHRRSSPWRDQIARHSIEEHPSRSAAAFAESEAINTEFPLYNKQGRRTEPKSVTLARKKAAEEARAAARRMLARRRKAKDTAEERLRTAVLEGREAGLVLTELAALSGYSFEEVRRMARMTADRKPQRPAGSEEKTG